MDARQVIVRPVVSEKSYALMGEGKYTFRVHDRAHKLQIAQAIEEIFDVKVRAVRTSTVKSSRSGAGSTAAARAPGRRPSSSSPPASGSSCSRARRWRARPWPNRKTQTDQPGPPLRHLPDARGAHGRRAEQEAHQGQELLRRPQHRRPGHRAPPRRRRQAPLPADRLQAHQGRDPGTRGLDRVRPEPLGEHRAAQLRRRREALHPRPAGASGRRRGRLGRGRRHRARATRCPWRASRPAPWSTTSS